MAGTGSSTCQIRELVADKVKDEERTKCWEKTYRVIGDSMLRVD